ncbi:MAG: GNAT family N-acetyltransferase [Rhodospirillaceae bacterium]|nr:GNAT family N-acetyltransferase [Rhodospirillaceae bacterium]
MGSGMARGSARAPRAPEVTLRAAGEADYAFALALYLESTRRLLTALGRWDEPRVLARFAQGWRTDQVQVICADDMDIGWIQVSQTGDRLHLDQLHLVEGYRGRGIGTQLIEELLDRARADGRAVGLNVIRGNGALALYRRLGFTVVGEDPEKLRMLWSPAKRQAG